MNYKIEEWPAFKVVGIRNRINTSKAFEFIPQIWDKAWKDDTMNKFIELFQIANYRPTGFLGISAGGQWGNSEEMDYILAVTNFVDTPLCDYVPPLDGMEEFSYPSATWAIFEANGEPPEAVQKIYKQFHTEWFPNSGYKLADLPVIESYIEDNHQEVWIAVEKI